MALLNPASTADALIDGCANVETPAELRSRLAAGRPLRVKFGVDPTGSELHLGHAVVLHKMQQFVDAGHDVTLLIGDFTALIGDPSGRNDSRPHLTREAIAQNMRTYTEQAGKILDLERITVRYNSEWLGALDLAALIRLLSQTTVAQMLSREDFRNRYTGGTPIALHEFLYPVAQAYDSVALACDVELGGDDQLFNFLLARAYQINAGQPPQICMTLPILEGTDGKIRMGKSKGNYIALAEPAREQFGKVMRIPDALTARWARLADFRSQAECEALERGIRGGTLVAMEEKKKLAYNIVARYHGDEAARREREWFENTIQAGRAPADLREVTLRVSATREGFSDAPALTVTPGGHASPEPANTGAPRETIEMQTGKLADIVVKVGFAPSKREAQRLIAQGAVRIDGEPVTDAASGWPSDRESVVLQVGSRRFIRIHQSPAQPKGT